MILSDSVAVRLQHYRDVTRLSEARIASLLGDSGTPGSDVGDGIRRKEWAYGVYLSWLDQTQGMRYDIDADRLYEQIVGM